MGMAEIRDAFEAYASGELAEYELRSALRAEVQTQPGSVHRYAAMAAALRRRNLISADLEAAVVSDMNEVVAQSQPVPAASASDAPTRASMREPPPLEPPDAPAVEISRPRQMAGNDPSASRGSAWDTKARLAEPEIPVSLGMVLRERFELIEELGRGGMGVVYKAIDQREVENKGRDPYVAIKVLNDEFKRHPESARALQRESKKSMRLAHPNIVLVRDFDRDRGVVYMVMELLYGTPLDQLVLKEYPKGMPLNKVIEIVNGLGAALSYAHQQGIVHADFKPSNAFLSNQNVVKVLDFGVARVALALDRGDSTIFDAGKLNAVSPAYASIEMLVGEAPDPRDDIYGLACVTYFLLTGRHPFSGIDAIKARDSSLLPMPVNGLGDQQWRAIRQALTFERWDRTPSVKEFLAQFCIEPNQRPARVSPASRIVSGATRLADGAAKKPWLIGAPAGALLAAGLAFLIVRALPKPTPGAAASTAVVTQHTVKTAVAAPSPTAPGSNLTVLQQRLSVIDVNAPDFLDRAAAAASDLKLLEQQAPTDESARKFRASVLLVMSKRVAYLLEHDNADEARKAIARVGELLPAGALKSFSADALNRRQELGHLVATAASNQKWADQLNVAIRNVTAVAAADDPLIKDARETSDTTYQLAADDARSKRAFDQAGAYLSMGLTVNPQSPALQRAMLEIAKAKASVPPVVANTAVAAPASPPPTATTPPPAAAVMVPVAAVSVPGASTPSAAAGSPASAPVPQSVDTIIEQAKQEMLLGKVDDALKIIQVARNSKKFGADARLRNLEVTYDRVGEEFERLDLTGSVSVAKHQESLSEIRSLAGAEDYPQIEQMLARTLANDIADQRTHSDRGSVVADLLKSGRALFPEYADLLEHGKAGTTADPATPPASP